MPHCCFIPHFAWVLRSVIPPPPGYSIAVLGALAMLITLRKEPSRREKAVWIFCAFLLMFFEMWAISRDRSNQERGHIQDITALQSGFKATLQAIQSSRIDVAGLASQVQEAKQYILRIRSGSVAPSELKLESLELSKDILEFLRQRALQAPPTSKPPPKPNWIIVGGNIDTDLSALHSETETLLNSTYGAHLKEITSRLRRAGVLQGYVCDLLYSTDTYASCAVEISEAARRLPN